MYELLRLFPHLFVSLFPPPPFLQQLCFCDEHSVRLFDPSTQIVQTLLGQPSRSGRRYGPAGVTKLSRPRGVAADPAGNLYIADTGNDRVNFYDAATQEMQLLLSSALEGTPGGGVGRGQQGTGVDGNGRATTLLAPHALTLDPTTGCLLIAEAGGHRLRRIATPVAADHARPSFHEAIVKSTRALTQVGSAVCKAHADLTGVFTTMDKVASATADAVLQARQQHFRREAVAFHSHAAAAEPALATSKLRALLLALPRINMLRFVLPAGASQALTLVESVVADMVPDLVQRYAWLAADSTADLTLLCDLVGRKLLLPRSAAAAFASEAFRRCNAITPRDATTLTLLSELLAVGASIGDEGVDALATGAAGWLEVHQRQWAEQAPAAAAALARTAPPAPSGTTDGEWRRTFSLALLQQHLNTSN